MAKCNHCKVCRLLSECGAEKPEECKFYKKAKYHSRCTFQTINLGDGDWNCSCVEARDCKLKEQEKTDELLFLEQEEGKME